MNNNSNKPKLPTPPVKKIFSLSILNKPVNASNSFKTFLETTGQKPTSTTTTTTTTNNANNSTIGIKRTLSQSSVTSYNVDDDDDEFYRMNSQIPFSQPSSSYSSQPQLATQSTQSQNDKYEQYENLGDGSYKIANYNVKFPYKPYACQASMMARILTGLENSENCLLESPTGTGKTLSLLCSTLEWQKQDKLDKIRKCEEKKQLARDSKQAMAHKKLLSQGIDPVTGLLLKTTPSSPTSPTTTTTTTTKSPPPKIITTTVSKYEDLTGNDDQDDLYRGLQTDFNGIGINKFDAKPTAKKVKKIVAELKTYAKTDDGSGNGPTEGDSEENEEKFRAKTSPTIFFCSRTHSQIKQLTGELKKTPYRPNMVVLASRDHYCVNPILKDVPKKKEKCMKLLMDQGCRYNKKEFSIPKLSTFQQGGVKEVWDIEDLMQAGRDHKECAFFVSKDMVEKADLVFCPYNYLIDPSIRRSLKDKVKDAIIIFDEAHNIEDALMEASSFETSFDDIVESLTSFKEAINNPRLLKSISPAKVLAIEYFYALLEKVNAWIRLKINELKPVDFEKHQNVWKGKDIVGILEKFGLDKTTHFKMQDQLSVLNDADDESVGAGSKSALSMKNAPKDAIAKIEPVPSKSILILESFQKVVEFIFTNENWIDDYRLVLQKHTVYQSKQQQNKGNNSNSGSSGSNWNYTFGIWALSPRIAFSSLTKTTRSVILTSGTLSPLYSFPSELASKFPISAEMGNLPDIKQRAWIGTLASGVGDVKLNCTHGPSESLTFQDSLGETILKHIEIIPDGVLCFFPSYGFLEKVLSRLDKTGVLKKINSVKRYFYEPKVQAQFIDTLAQYRECIRSGKGAILFAVCRGKVSEGIDFSDEYARGVMVVGIPFPSMVDLRVILKKDYNESNKNKGAISGGDWYRLQAFRALNQALGRCIRHKNDYGSILLIDERFSQESQWNNLSKWAKQCIKNNRNTNTSLSSLKSFYENINKYIDSKQ